MTVIIAIYTALFIHIIMEIMKFQVFQKTMNRAIHQFAQETIGIIQAQIIQLQHKLDHVIKQIEELER